jgi:hypothetical protein
MSLFLVVFAEPDFVITRETIQECHHLTTCGRIDDLVYSGEGEIILSTTLIQVSEVSAHSPFSILFLDHHHIC